MSEISESEEAQKMRDYWLEQLTEEESFQAESDWLGEEEKTTRLEIARDDLIDDYLNERLNADEKYAFETRFLAIPANLEMVAIAKSFRKLIDAKTVAAFDAETASQTAPTVSFGEKMRTFFFPNHAENTRFNFSRRLNLSQLGGFAVLLVGLTIGFFVVSRQFSPVTPEIAKTENTNLSVPPNFDLTGNQNPASLNNTGSGDYKSGNLERENGAVNPPPKNMKRESDPVNPRQSPKPADRPPVPQPQQQQLVQNPMLMGEGTGAGCVLQINNSPKSVSIKLLTGEKPTAVEIKLAGEQNPLLILPVKTKSGQKTLSVTFPVKDLEQGKKYRFTLLEGDRRRNLEVCEVNKINP